MKANKTWKKVLGVGLAVMLSATALTACGSSKTQEGLVHQERPQRLVQ